MRFNSQRNSTYLLRKRTRSYSVGIRESTYGLYIFTVRVSRQRSGPSMISLRRSRSAFVAQLAGAVRPPCRFVAQAHWGKLA